MTKELTIIGATGSLSTRVTRLMLERGVRLKLVARSVEKARGLFGPDVEVVRGDVTDESSLRDALRGSRAVYVHLNTDVVDDAIEFYAEREGVRNIVAAAEANGVEHLIQIAGIESLRPDFFTAGIVATAGIREQGMKAIEDSAIPHTFLSCSLFLDSLPRFVADSTFAVFGSSTNRVHFTSTDQLALHLHHVVGDERAFGRNLPVQGVRGLDLADGATEFFGGFDPTVRVERLPMDVIDTLGLPAAEAAFLKHVAEVSAGLQEQLIAADVHAQFGTPDASIRDFGLKLRAEQGG